MIDMLALRCPFVDQKLQLKDLKIPLEASIDVDGDIIDTRHAWENIPSSYAPLAFKVFDFRSDEDGGLFIEIKASPAKIMQGHNLYGTDCLKVCALALLEVLYLAYPDMCDLLWSELWQVVQVDVTYFSRMDGSRQLPNHTSKVIDLFTQSTINNDYSPSIDTVAGLQIYQNASHDVKQFINALGNVSNGQTKARTGFDGTVYYGKKNSRLKKIKVYSKYHEVIHQLKRMQNSSRESDRKLLSCYHQGLLDWSIGMVRWEASLKTRWFERRGIPTILKDMITVFNAQAHWTEATQDIFKALEGQEMRVVSDDNVREQLREKYPTTNERTGKVTYGKADAYYRTYTLIQVRGYVQASSMLPVSTFNKHVAALIEGLGISKAHLQNMQGDGLKGEVVPFTRFIGVNFAEQFPPWYEHQQRSA